MTASCQTEATLATYAARKRTAALCLYGSGGSLALVCLIAALPSSSACCAVPIVVFTLLAASIVLVVTGIMLDSQVLNTCPNCGDSQVIGAGNPFGPVLRTCPKCGTGYLFNNAVDEQAPSSDALAPATKARIVSEFGRLDRRLKVWYYLVMLIAILGYLKVLSTNGFAPRQYVHFDSIDPYVLIVAFFAVVGVAFIAPFLLKCPNCGTRLSRRAGRMIVPDFAVQWCSHCGVALTPSALNSDTYRQSASSRATASS